MLPFGVTIPATVLQRSEIPAGLMNYPVVQKFLSSCTRVKCHLAIFELKNTFGLGAIFESYLTKSYLTVHKL